MAYSRNDQRNFLDGCFLQFVYLMIGGGLLATLVLALVIAAFVALTDEHGSEEIVLRHITLSEDEEFTVLETTDGRTLTYKGVYQLPTESKLEVHWGQHLWSEDRWISSTKGEDVFTALAVKHFDEPERTIVQASDGRSFRYSGIEPIPIGERVTIVWKASSEASPRVTFIKH